MPRKNSSLKQIAADAPQEDSKEAKKQRRLIRNRLSAQMHRERQRAYMSGLQHQVAALTAERDLWRQAFDAVAARHCTSTGEDLECLLSGISLPLPAEQVAPPPPPATGQAARGPDGCDVMVDLMDRAKTSILPRGRAAEADAVARANARIVNAMASGQAAHDADTTRRTSRSTRRRASKRRHDSTAEESDDTEATTGRRSAAGSSDSEWTDATSPAKRLALNTAVQPSFTEEAAEVPLPVHAPLPFDPEEVLASGLAGLEDMGDADDEDDEPGSGLPTTSLASFGSTVAPLVIPNAATVETRRSTDSHIIPPLPGVDEDPDEDLDGIVPPPPLLDSAPMASRQASIGIDSVV